MSTQLIPLFPLSLVLLPGSPLPLHIFEQRYKEMMADIIPVSGEFGVVLAKDNGIVNIGCTAAVERVVQRYPDGRLDLLTMGQRRFRVESVVDDDKSYLRAEVEFFDDEDLTGISPELRQRAIDAFEQLSKLEKPGIALEPKFKSPRLSFQLAQYMMDLEKRQVMLALRSEVDRLEFLIRAVPEYVARQEQTSIAKRVAPLNGHARHVVTS